MAKKEFSTDPVFIVAEYNALRNEIIKRLEFRLQITNLTLVSAGTFLTIGVQEKIPASVLFIYPLVAFFLAANWTHNGAVIMQLGNYIRENIEAENPELKWESYGAKKYSFGWLSTLSTSGLILITQVVAIVLALLKTTYTPIEVVLLVCSIIMVFSTAVLLGFGITGLQTL